MIDNSAAYIYSAPLVKECEWLEIIPYLTFCLPFPPIDQLIS